LHSPSPQIGPEHEPHAPHASAQQSFDPMQAASQKQPPGACPLHEVAA
jgi:hypothetical protein